MSDVQPKTMRQLIDSYNVSVAKRTEFLDKFKLHMRDYEQAIRLWPSAYLNMALDHFGLKAARLTAWTDAQKINWLLYTMKDIEDEVRRMDSAVRAFKRTMLQYNCDSSIKYFIDNY